MKLHCSLLPYTLTLFKNERSLNNKHGCLEVLNKYPFYIDRSKYDVCLPLNSRLFPEGRKLPPLLEPHVCHTPGPGPQHSLATLATSGPGVTVSCLRALRWPEPEFLRCEWSSQCRKCPPPSGPQSQSGSRQEKTFGHPPQCSNQRYSPTQFW